MLLETRGILDNCELDIDKDLINSQIDKLEDWLYDIELYSLEEYDNNINEFNNLIPDLVEQKNFLVYLRENIREYQNISDKYRQISNSNKNHSSNLLQVCNEYDEIYKNVINEVDDFFIGKVISSNLKKVNEYLEEFDKKLLFEHDIMVKSIELEKKMALEKKRKEDEEKKRIDEEKKRKEDEETKCNEELHNEDKGNISQESNDNISYGKQ